MVIDCDFPDHPTRAFFIHLRQFSPRGGRSSLAVTDCRMFSGDDNLDLAVSVIYTVINRKQKKGHYGCLQI
jgi:hypothetical protein